MRGRVCDSRAPHSARPTSPSFGGSSRSRGSTRWCWGWSRRDVLSAHGFSPLRSSPPEWLQLSSIGIASHGDDDFSLSVSLFQITDGVGDLAQRVSSVDDRCDLSGFEELLQDGHRVTLACLRVNRLQCLVHLRSCKMLPHVDQRELPLGTSIVLGVPDPGVERQVLLHPLVRVQVDGIESRPPGFGFRKLEEGPSKTLPAMGGINGDVVDKEPFFVNGEDDYPNDGPVDFSDGYLPAGDDLSVIVGHRAGQHPETLDIVAVGCVDERIHFRDICLLCGSQRILKLCHNGPDWPDRSPGRLNKPDDVAVATSVRHSCSATDSFSVIARLLQLSRSILGRRRDVPVEPESVCDPGSDRWSLLVRTLQPAGWRDIPQKSDKGVVFLVS